MVVVGIGRDGVGALVSEAPDGGRSALLASCEGLPAVTVVIDRLLDDLAELALHRWPRWHGRGDSVDPVAADPWLKAASKRARLGQPLRFRRMARELEFGRLLGAIDPAGIVLIWEVDSASAMRARPVIEALEWCGRHGAAVVAALTGEPPETAPYDRLLYGARALVREERGAVARFIAPAGPHPASEIERRVAAALEQDADLAGLFVCNASVPVGEWGARPRVDLLCRVHRIVVELDGPEHRSEPKFGNDRHRDYELLTAGYLVLRLTNEQVAADLPLAIEKIRAVVRLRRGTKGGKG
jgi:very-short-patch-repair endonuclease